MNIKFLLIVSITLNFILLIFVFKTFNNSQDGLPSDILIVNSEEKQCLMESENNKILTSEVIYGPDALQDFEIVRVESKFLKDDFEFRYSQCFHDSYSIVGAEESIDSVVALYKSRGFENITIHKSGLNSHTFVSAKKSSDPL